MNPQRIVTAPRPAAECIAPESLRQLLRYDSETGKLYWLVNRGRNARTGSEAGTVLKRGVVSIRINGKFYLAHQLAWVFIHGQWAESELDHRDGDPRNNRPENLRKVDRNGNLQNYRRATARNKNSGLLGAYRGCRGRWFSSIHTNGKTTYLGSFDTKEEAHAAYVTAKRRLHPTCTI